MKVIAIDPGYERMGIAVIEGTGSDITLLHSECLITDKKNPFTKRLGAIATTVRSLIATWKPDTIALETLFFTNNQKTAMRVAETRGALLLIGEECGLTIAEYSPGEIKVATANHGSADKDDVRRMVHRLIAMPDKKMLDDEVDAIAVGITHIACTPIHQQSLR